MTSTSKRRKFTNHLTDHNVEPIAPETSRQSTETQTYQTRNGLPKRLLIMQELQKRARSAVYLEDDEDDDSDYIPSEDDSEEGNKSEMDGSCSDVHCIT